ncbi:hypothetical protein HG535_0D00490 [Zygotorulaspora mrakii]|uniref:Mannosyltransferase n=1 Tax=Zygotorulaspora mrakii TaxID=42260 RepID=A0A7H9B3L1_ZYGMR|nr:uncharacterized protein HG535_0D00490 [Zygotorulaspora mrakii]QLG72342.1 hypothetical protein HG535_0D00490 [Zygotorulaspora mrakii]
MTITKEREGPKEQLTYTMKSCKLITGTLIILLAFSRVFLQPIFSIISDCDETFNYWEPLNLLVRGFGKQTWEYSPEYSIRSWAFLLPFASLLYPLNKALAFNAEWNFYIVRGLLGFGSFILEISLHREISRTLSISIANYWLLFQIFNPGWFHASVELLPSAIAMLLCLGSSKHALNYLSTDSTSSFLASITFNLIGGVLGWPFVLVLSLPICLHYLFHHKLIVTVRTVFDSLVIVSLVVAATFTLDSLFYGKFTPVSWNIFWYNVINADASSGPNIFGVESWTYYVFNLFLNFPLPVLILSIIGISRKRLWPLWLSLITWLLIFTSQPHKEERFLYPIYSLLSLAAAVGFSTLLKSVNRCKLTRSVIKLCIIAFVIIQATSRIMAILDNYSAPLDVYSTLYDLNNESDDIVNVCTGREWYHFPNSFFLPDNYRLRFVSSGFDGLLPGDFSEEGNIFSKIRKIPKGMNKKNIFDEGKLWPISKCDYFVDITSDVNERKDAFDPNSMPQGWIAHSCAKFVDVENSKILGRSFYFPTSIAELLSSNYAEYWSKIYGTEKVDYCLFEQVKNV